MLICTQTVRCWPSKNHYAIKITVPEAERSFSGRPAVSRRRTSRVEYRDARIVECLRTLVVHVARVQKNQRDSRALRDVSYYAGRDKSNRVFRSVLRAR